MSELCRIVERYPSGIAFEPAPLGSTLAAGFLDNGEHTLAGVMSNRTIVGARAFADVQVWDRHPHPVRLKCGRCLGGIRRRTEQSVDLLRDVWELTLQIWAGTGGRSEPLVHGEVAGLVAGVVELCDVVALADIRAERDELGKRRIADVPVPADLVICDLDGDGAVVIGAVGTAPSAPHPNGRRRSPGCCTARPWFR